mgnify:CR=1 FL=1
MACLGNNEAVFGGNGRTKQRSPISCRNCAILPALDEPPRGKRERAAAYAQRALQELERYRSEHE